MPSSGKWDSIHSRAVLSAVWSATVTGVPSPLVCTWMPFRKKPSATSPDLRATCSTACIADCASIQRLLTLRPLSWSSVLIAPTVVTPSWRMPATSAASA